MVREQIPTYKQVVEGVVAEAAAAVASASIATNTPAAAHPTPAIIYRPHDETKAPYRIIEKALTKGPRNPTHPDCSKVLDVFGCIIDCADYVSMAAVVAAFAAQHQRGELQLSRIKDRWTAPSSGGWRDLMLNLVINGIVFEVQIVHTKMLGARTGMDAHKAYNQFRSFFEIFDMLDIDTELDKVVVGEGGAAAANDEELAAVRAELEQLKLELEAEREELASEKAGREIDQAEIARLRAMLAVHGIVNIDD